MRLTIKSRHEHKIEAQRFVRIVEIKMLESLLLRHGNADLFFKLTNHGLLSAFSRFHLTTGELPKTAFMQMVGTFGDENFALI
ncbi:Uncharacterised protein [Vibrio cholerae]|nr:Uncharacterised protein [Vibrio cholerae]CSB02853.1 Uncharacterised protein [Vibrio cholerae]CSB13914.1 Uncharacterised protein [Vibrio cholerae]CSB65198.1 Uncharacterised protein [Vibrio cholerae]CSC64877.1 Uncharacterised protein [Vibrio cholerae]